MLLSPTLERLLFQWLRAAEYTCDRAAILVAQDWRLAANTILKINVGNPGKIYGSSPNVDAFLEQGERLREETKSSSGTFISERLEQQSTHPLPVVRVRMMKEWSESAQYKGIIARGTRDSC
jgi:Zn-dependent protease with chaperone function